MPAQPLFKLEGDFSGQPQLPVGPKPLQVVRVEDSVRKVRRRNVFETDASVFEHHPIDVERSTIDAKHADALWYGVRDATQLRFRFSQSFLRSLTTYRDQRNVARASD